MSNLKKYLPAAQIGFILAASVLVFSFVSASREGEARRRCAPLCALKPVYAGADKLAPPFTLKDMQGRDVSLSDYRGRVVVLNFWTKTCAACLDEMPSLAELTKVLSSRGDVAVLAVATDDGPAAVADTLKSVLRDPPPFTVLFDPSSSVVGDKYGTNKSPETWIIDQNGIVRARFDGARDWTSATVVELIEQIHAGGYCAVEIHDTQVTGEAASACEGA